MNVVGSTPDGWWRDRRGAMKRLAEALSVYVSETGDRITVVFDGQPFEVEAPGVDVAFAPHADDEIVRIAASGTGDVTVVTSDRELRERVQSHGAATFPARSFRQRLGKM